MLRTFLTWFSVLTTTCILAACCGSVSCECNDTYADAIGFRFSSADSTDAAKGFSSASIDTVYVVRMPTDTAQRPRADTAIIARPRNQAFTRPVIINNASPFALATGRKISNYRYKLYLAPRRRATPTFIYSVDSVQLKTNYVADGCCTCYQNTNKIVSITDQKGNKQQLNLTDDTGKNELRNIVLVRPQ